MRAFFALWPDEAARSALAKLAHAIVTQAGGRAPPEANVHLTLAFVGDIPESRVDGLRAIGAAAAATVPAFELTLDRVGTFRGSGIAWAGTSVVPAELARLAAEVTAALAAQGFAVDARPFEAHVTLARRCRNRTAMPMATPIAWPVTRLVLNASDLSRGAPHYRELAGWPLVCRTPGAAD